MNRTNVQATLKQYLTDEQLKSLDWLQQEVLATYCSPHTLKNLRDQTPATITALIDEPMQKEIGRRLSEVHEDELETMMQWYMANGKEVETIHCPSKEHKTSIIAVRVLFDAPDVVNKHTAHLDGSFYVGVIGKLMSYRPRLDKVVGVQCICGNSNLWSQIELDNVPKEHVNSSLTPDDLFRVNIAIEQSGHKPNIKKLKTGRYTIDNFEMEKVK